MSSSAKQFSLLIFLILLFFLQIHARESQFFNQVLSNNNENNYNVFEDSEVPKELGKQDENPYFIPQTENGYGLFGHESSHLPPSTIPTTSTGDAPYKITTNLPYNAKTEEPLNKAYLPSNYNPVAYVTKPEGYIPQTFENEPKGVNNANLPKNYNTEAYLTGPQGLNEANLPKNYNTEAYVTEPQGLNEANLPKDYVIGPQGMSDTRFVDRDYTALRGNNYYNGKSGGNFPVQQQGMSDTKFLENGEYYHDVNNEKDTRNANENAKVMDSTTKQNNRAFYGINDNTYEYNNNNNYNSRQRFHNQEDQFQDSQQDEYPWP